MERAGVLAWRAHGHHLDARLPIEEMTAAVGAVGIRDQQGWGVVALHARVDGVAAQTLDDGLAAETVVDVVSARGARTLVPRDDVAVFTVGTLPSDEASLRTRLKAFLPQLDRSGFTATAALAAAIDVAREALATGAIDIGALSGALTRQLPALSPVCRGRCGVAHIEQGLFDLVGESGVWRVVRDGRHAMFVAMEIAASREAARAELVRRYLRCYGPSTPVNFAAWCGISKADAEASLAGQEADGTSSPIAGVRLLPPRDPYLLDRDRDTLVPDRAAQKRIWRATPTDGVVLVDGEPGASWRAKKKGRNLRFHVAAFAPLSKRALKELETEAALIAAIRGCVSAEVVV